MSLLANPPFPASVGVRHIYSWLHLCCGFISNYGFTYMCIYLYAPDVAVPVDAPEREQPVGASGGGHSLPRAPSHHTVEATLQAQTLTTLQVRASFIWEGGE